MSELEQLVDELYHSRRLKFPRRRVLPRSYSDYAQLDLIQLNNIATHNDNYNFCALLVNVYSKKIYVEKLKNKSQDLVLDAYKKIFERCDVKFENFLSDAGREYRNAVFIRYITHVYGAKLFFSYSLVKASVAELSNKIFKHKLYRLMAINTTYRWLDLYRDAEHQVNERVHSGYKKKVSSINSKNAKSIAWYYDRHRNPPLATNIKFPINSIVRYENTSKEIFHKSYLTNWSIRQYRVVAVSKKIPPLYTICDRFTNKPLLRRFYEPELQLVKNPEILLLDKIWRVDKKRKKYLVSFLGYDDMPREWISYGDVFKNRAEADAAKETTPNVVSKTKMSSTQLASAPNKNNKNKLTSDNHGNKKINQKTSNTILPPTASSSSSVLPSSSARVLRSVTSTMSRQKPSLPPTVPPPSTNKIHKQKSTPTISNTIKIPGSSSAESNFKQQSPAAKTKRTLPVTQVSTRILRSQAKK